MPKLSVVVPFFNVAAYATDVLQSLAHNAGPDVEFVLVDDASTDGTADILARGARRLPGSSVLTLPVNSGLSAARNAGLDAARGRYLAFLDGDDAVAPGYYAELVAVIEQLGCDFVRTDHVQVRGRRREVHRICHAPRGVVCAPRSGIGGAQWRSSVDAAYAWAGIYSRAVLDDGLLHFDEDLRTCEDRPWIWRQHLRARSFAVVGLRGVRYRRDVSTSLTQLGDERQFDVIAAFERLVADVRADRDADRFLSKALRTYCAVACHHLASLDRFPPDQAHTFSMLMAASFRRLPQPELTATVGDLDEQRATTIRGLLDAA